MNYIKTWKEVMLRPSDFFRRMPTTGGYSDPLIFALISIILSVLFFTLFCYGMFRFGVNSSILTLGIMHGPIFNFFTYSVVSLNYRSIPKKRVHTMYLMKTLRDSLAFGFQWFKPTTTYSNIIKPFAIGIQCSFIMAQAFNLVSKALGGTGSYEGTMRFMLYTNAPAVLTWIPILNLVAGIYFIYLNIVGGMIVTCKH